MSDYATVDDVIALFRPLDAAEAAKAAALIPVVCDRLRQEAMNVGKDLDQMVAAGKTKAAVAKSVTVDIVARCLLTPTSGAPVTQFSQSAIGYSVSGTYMNPGGGIFIKNAELKLLGIKRQQIGGIEIYGKGQEESDGIND